MMDAFELPTTLVQALRRRAVQEPERLALRFLAEDDGEGVVLSYRDLDLRARSIAAALQAHAQLGDRAVLLFPAALTTSRRSSVACMPGSSRCRPIRRSRRAAITRNACCRSSPTPSRAWS